MTAPPAATSPVTRRRAGAASLAPATSAARIAYPSIAELSQGGRSVAAATSVASTRPRASASATVSGGSADGMAARTRARASSIGISSFIAAAAPCRDRSWTSRPIPYRVRIPTSSPPSTTGRPSTLDAWRRASADAERVASGKPAEAAPRASWRAPPGFAATADRPARRSSRRPTSPTRRPPAMTRTTDTGSGPERTDANVSSVTCGGTAGRSRSMASPTVASAIRSLQDLLPGLGAAGSADEPAQQSEEEPVDEVPREREEHATAHHPDADQTAGSARNARTATLLPGQPPGERPQQAASVEREDRREVHQPDEAAQEADVGQSLPERLCPDARRRRAGRPRPRR